MTQITCLHGFMGDSHDFDQLKNTLHNLGDTTIEAIDLPCHGKTNFLKTSENITFENTLHALKEQTLPSTVLLGYSMGARIALSYTYQHPEDLKALILIGGHPGLETKKEKHERNRREHDRALGLKKNPQQFLEQWSNLELFSTIPREILNKQEHKRQLQLKKRNDQAILWAKALESYSLGRQENLWPKLSQLEIPILLLIGENDHKYSKILQQMHLKIKNSQLAIISQAGHMPHLEQPLKTAEVLQQFIDSLQDTSN